MGQAFLENPLVRKLTFTGSTGVGKLLAKGAAEQMKRISLELGGHAPFIVFQDADPVFAAKGAMLVNSRRRICRSCSPIHSGSTERSSRNRSTRNLKR